MKAFVIVAGVLLAVASCTRIFGSTERKTCQHIESVCSDFAGMDAKDVDECTDGLPDLKKKIDADDYTKFISCADDAKNCAEVAGCAVGLGANVIDKMSNDLERGFDKMRSK